jgi:hypothetical protein
LEGGIKELRVFYGGELLENGPTLGIVNSREEVDSMTAVLGG